MSGNEWAFTVQLRQTMIQITCQHCGLGLAYIGDNAGHTNESVILIMRHHVDTYHHDGSHHWGHCPFCGSLKWDYIPWMMPGLAQCNDCAEIFGLLGQLEPGGSEI